MVIYDDDFFPLRATGDWHCMNMIECVVFSVSALIRYPFCSSYPNGDNVRMTRAPSRRMPAFHLPRKVIFYICIHLLGAVMADSVGISWRTFSLMRCCSPRVSRFFSQTKNRAFFLRALLFLELLQVCNRRRWGAYHDSFWFGYLFTSSLRSPGGGVSNGNSFAFCMALA